MGVPRKGREKRNVRSRDAVFTATSYVCVDKLAAGSDCICYKSVNFPRPGQPKPQKLTHIWTLTSKNHTIATKAGMPQIGNCYNLKPKQWVIGSNFLNSPVTV